MINRVIGVDFGTSTSVVCYCDYTDGKPGAVEYILFGGHKHSPTLILRDGTVKNKQGVEKHCEEQYGWNAENSNSFYTLLESNFKMDLISADAVKREKAEGLTRKFFAYLFQAYQSGNTVRKGQEPDSVITYITYPGKFPPPVQEFLAGCAKAAGFENVSLLAEACAAMSYAQTHDTEATKKFFDSHQNKALKVMLIDMGAGTTDIAIFDYDTGKPDSYRPVSFYPKDGSENFGGREIDNILCDFYTRKIGTEISRILGQGNVALGEKILSADVKIFKEQQLSLNYLKQNQLCDEVPGRLSTLIWQLPDPTVTNIDRKIFEELLKNYLPQFTRIVNGSLSEAGLFGSDIDLVLLTGGHSQWYFVKDYLCNKTNLKIAESAVLSFPEPHLVVADGAAVSYRPPKPRYVPAQISVNPAQTGESAGKKDGGKVSKPKNRYESKYREFKPCGSDCFINWGGCSTKGYQCSSNCECDVVCAAFDSNNCEHDSMHCQNYVPCAYCHDCDDCRWDGVFCDREYG